ncbi:MFS transporter [Streptosporangium sp. 'caverna']|uniref:MFS transporter n=1 Tax=Streptosporangium sp. 'caverna' TaxID=2202249 RepID=UPI000D7D95EB|nr:MFS transporter [Streptosporangium sp. 'caverna']AWS44270.1 MFS transporter [Streptosporangium sp. 'caverna']
MDSISTAQKWGTMAIAAVGGLVLSIDLTVLHLAIPRLVTDLHPSATQILWIADGYAFAIAALLITMGWLGDHIGRKRLLLIGVGAIAVTSTLTAYAPNAELLIVARVLLGAAGATFMPSALGLIRNVFRAHKERAMAVGMFTGVSALGVGMGPLVGGALLDHFWWGSVFLCNVPVMLVMFVAGVLLLPESRDPGSRTLDFPSVALSAAGVVGCIWAIKEMAANGVEVTRLVVGIVGAVLLVMFVRRQSRLADPLIDFRLFRIRAYSGSIVVNMIAMFSIIAQSLMFAQFWQLVLDWSPWQAGLAGLPSAVGGMIGGAALAPLLINLLGRARAITVGLVIGAGAFGASAVLLDQQINYVLVFAAIMLTGLGMSITLAITSDTILATVPKTQAGSASAASETASQLGAALGIALLGSVVNAVYRSEVSVPSGITGDPAARIGGSLAGAVEAAAELPADLAGQAVAAARSAFVDALHINLYCSVALALAAAAVALLTLGSVPKIISDDAEGQSEEEAQGEQAAAGPLRRHDQVS